ncbi:hypothetical protein Xhom_03527 [Xenorhabdus hominickii]|uniref:Uncharacterized protein n=1 Tax=Xenorhabdus hominickii TaxID=351679 RepID=A0A2G0Q2U2_XENHO|nr:hypothetical protein Xhom_03527 [Xenorhabdus hominickii]
MCENSPYEYYEIVSSSGGTFCFRFLLEFLLVCYFTFSRLKKTRMVILCHT